MNTLLALSIAIAAGLAVSRLARLVRLPNVTAFLVGGLIIGPSVLGILPGEMMDGFSVITEAALGFIAYSIGAEFKLSYLKRIGAKPLTITAFEGLGAVILVDIALIGCSLAGVPGFDLSPVEESVRLLRQSAVEYEFRTTLLRELHTEADLDDIAAWLEGAPRYFLQNFVDSGNLIGQGGYHGFSPEELRALAERVRPHFGRVELRGVD